MKISRSGGSKSAERQAAGSARGKKIKKGAEW